VFGVLLTRLGVANVLGSVATVGWVMALIIAAEILAYAANTLGWRAAFPPGEPAPPFPRLLAARIAGDAANYLTPTATLGGEFVRARLLEGHAPMPPVVASVMVAKLTQTLGLVAFLAVGLVVVLDETTLSASARAAVFAGLAVFTGVLAALLILQRRGVLTTLLRLGERWIGPQFLAPLRRSIEEVDAEIVRRHKESGGRIVLSAAGFAVGFALGTVESFLVLWGLGVPVTFKLALAVEVLGVAFNNVFFFVPLRAGTQEAGKALVFALLGLDPARGLAAGVIYRIRELSWALIGLGILALHRLQARTARPSPAAAGPGQGPVPGGADRRRPA